RRIGSRRPPAEHLCCVPHRNPTAELIFLREFRNEMQIEAGRITARVDVHVDVYVELTWATPPDLRACSPITLVPRLRPSTNAASARRSRCSQRSMPGLSTSTSASFRKKGSPRPLTDPTRFKRSRSVGAYVGLTTRRGGDRLDGTHLEVW